MNDSPDKAPVPKIGVLAGNLGEPVKLTELQLNGVSAEAGRAGQKIDVWTRMA